MTNYLVDNIFVSKAHKHVRLDLDLDRNVINWLPVSGYRNHEYRSADPKEIFLDPQHCGDGKLNPH
jgi:hypothetical protein